MTVLTAALFASVTGATNVKEFCVEWINACPNDTNANGRPDLPLDEFLANQLIARVYENAPGCTLPTGGVWIHNSGDVVHFKVTMTGTFGNPGGDPQSCGGSCSSTDCECTASATEWIVKPGRTEEAGCLYPLCSSCDDCDNSFSECLSEPYCTEVQDSSFEIVAFSCDGANWLTSTDVAFLPLSIGPPTVVNECE